MKKSLTVLLISILVIGAGVSALAFSLQSKAIPKSPRTRMATFKSAEDFVRAFKNGQARYTGLAGEDGMSATKSAAPSGQSAEATPHSDTNVQVAGVDEADIVKNDGKYIYCVSGDSVIIVKAYPARDAGTVSRIALDRTNHPEEIFINGDRLVVIGARYQEEPGREERGRYVPNRGNGTFVSIYDISSREAPTLARTVEYEGDYSTSRMIGENVHVVLTTYPYYLPYDKDNVRASEIVPRYRVIEGAQRPGDLAPACDWSQVEYVDPDRFTSFLSIISVSLAGEGRSLNKRVIAGTSENVYASTDNLYIASTEYPQSYRPYSTESTDRSEKTTVFKFKLNGPKTDFVASAQVPGNVLDQFSMDEARGYFRIATTRGEVSRENSDSDNNVYVLDSEMKTAGRLEGLARGEKIYSARFAGDRAYLVTFKKVDPFFVLDLADPANPRVLGALKIPGYSDYLHPYDETHVIGIGKNAKDAGAGEGNFAWYQGMKIALFDVSDTANPRELYKTEIGDRGTDSYALEDHKAFLFDRGKNLLVLPVLLAELTSEQKASSDTQAYDYGKYTYQGAYVYDVSLENGISLKGRVSHIDDPVKLGEDYYYYDSPDAVRRSLYIGDNLYTISDSQIKINRLADLGEVKTVRLK